MFDNKLFLAGFLFAVVLTGYIIIIFNGLIRLKNNIQKAWSNIDVLLKQRSDELPKLVACVKGYMKHEQSVFKEVNRARADLFRARTISQKADANNEITSALKTLFALAENYPKLKANEIFLKLQERIRGLENEIADRREFYNDSVNAYNTQIQMFPDVIIATVFGYTEPKHYFKAEEIEKKSKINFKAKKSRESIK